MKVGLVGSVLHWSTITVHLSAAELAYGGKTLLLGDVPVGRKMLLWP